MNPRSRSFRCGKTANQAAVSSAPFDEVVASLRPDGRTERADALHDLIHKVAWTTGSELLGELGRKMTEIEREDGASISRDTQRKIEAAFASVRRVWPVFPR